MRPGCGTIGPAMADLPPPPPPGEIPPWAQPPPPTAPPAPPSPPVVPWGPPVPALPVVAKPAGGPWIVVLTLALAAVVLAVVGVALWLASGSTGDAGVVDIPARRDTIAPSTSPTITTPTTVTPVTPRTTTTVPTTAAPSLATLPRLDTMTPRITVNDADGRFRVTIPRNWGNLPTPLTDQNVWVPVVQLSSGELIDSDFLFVVRWAPADGCTLELCTAAVLERLKTVYPTITATTASDMIGGKKAIRIEATAADQRLVAWVVVEGDRYWVPQLRGPITTFDATLAVVRTVVAGMSFG